MSGRGYFQTNSAFRLHQRRANREKAKQDAAREKVLARMMELEAQGVPRKEGFAQAMAESTGAPIEVCRKKVAEWQVEWAQVKADAEAEAKAKEPQA